MGHLRFEQKRKMGLRPLNKTKQNKYRPKTQIDIDGLGTRQNEDKHKDYL